MMNYLLHNYPVYTWSLFFGLIADDPVVHFDDIVVTTGTNVFFPDKIKDSIKGLDQ